jgi:hypothetical protein
LARWFPNSEAVSIQKAALTGDAKVVFSNGVVATATGSIILNIPQRPLLELIRNSSLPEGLMSKRNYQGIHGIQTEIVTKLYLYYPVAWWLEVRNADRIGPIILTASLGEGPNEWQAELFFLWRAK